MRFVVAAEGDAVVFRVLDTPAVADFDELLARARSAARRSSLEEGEVAKAIAKIRATG